MRSSVVSIVAAFSALVAPAPVYGFQLASLLLGKVEPVSAGYKKGNVILAHAMLGRDGSPSEAYRAALTKVAELAQAKGYRRMGVTKVTDCGTLMMNGSIVVSHGCRIVAQMVRPDEVAKPQGKRKVVYFSVPDVLVGEMRPEGAELIQLPAQ